MIRGISLAAVACLSLDVLAEPVTFEWFEYTGRDAVFEARLPPGSYRNPILAGFYPDPSVTRAGDKFYLVTSTFAYFPGIPVFESADLVHWRQIGHVIDRPAVLNFNGLGISRGVFAPTIEYHDGTFYVLNTAVDSGGNYFVTARNPAGPWSDPVWLPGIEGIDPSLFFDTDGKAYILNNGAPAGPPKYQGHRAIWIQEFDVASRRPSGPRQVVLDGGVDISKQPIWIEGPHLYKRDGWYYLWCAEGGTGPMHSQVVLRSRAPRGPFEPFPGNPVLSQRDQPADRPDPITNAGHADLVEAPDGTWWATFLASRTYEQIHYNTGRETFLLPVTWREGWPVVLEHGKKIPYVVPGPKFMRAGDQAPLSGNFIWRDEFDSPSLDLAWLQVRVPQRRWFELRNGALVIEPLSVKLDALGNPSFLARRQQHTTFDASTALRVPREENVSAGIVAFQNERYWYFFGVRRRGEQVEIFLDKKSGAAEERIASTTLRSAATIKLRVSGSGRSYSFHHDDGTGWQVLKENVDGSVLSTSVADGFVGAVLGPYARLEGETK